jgi:hypothetical protein
MIVFSRYIYNHSTFKIYLQQPNSNFPVYVFLKIIDYVIEQLWFGRLTGWPVSPQNPTLRNNYGRTGKQAKRATPYFCLSIGQDSR